MQNAGDCLLIEDLQNDFCEGGALAVPQGDAIVEPINHIMEKFSMIVASKDWHPVDHCSFKEQGGTWPSHCVQGTRGAQFHPQLRKERIHFTIHKANRPQKEAYSTFDQTSLEEELIKHHIKRVFVCGLATDYCVKETALDALKRGFETVILKDLVRAVNVEPGDGQKALDEVAKAGGTFATSEDILKGRINSFNE